MAIWDDVLPEIDREVYARGHWGEGRRLPERPVLLVIDAMYTFTGDHPMPILDAVDQHFTACGETAWESMGHIAELIAVCRERGIPIIYTVMEQRADGFDRGYARRGPEFAPPTDLAGSYANEIPDVIAPADEDVIICKPKPSAFFGTPLVPYLNTLRADSVIVTGCTTSGCVRAAAVDAGQYGYGVVVPEECSWDRGELTHKVNLFDIQMKCGPVMENAAVMDWLRTLPDHPFGDRAPTRRVPDPSELPVRPAAPAAEGATR
jgi:nicotinamidase-related amidase